MVKSPAWRWVAVTGLAVVLQACQPVAPLTQEPETSPVPAETSVPTEPAAQQPPAPSIPCDRAMWSVMMYLAVDNDLGDPESGDNMGAQMLESIKTGASDSNVQEALNIVVLYDQLGPEDTTIWASCIGQDGGLQPLEDSVNDLVGIPGTNEVNTGDSQTLANFVTWAKNNFPAEHYFLSLVSHGYGITPENVTAIASSRAHAYASLALAPPIAPDHWAQGGTGLAVDYTDAQNNDLYPTSIDSLSTQELRLGLEQSHVDILFFHACLMSMLEVAYEVRDYTDYIIAGENYLFGPGSYNLYLERLVQDAVKNLSPEIVATNWAQLYFNTVGSFEYPLEAGVIRTVDGTLDAAASAWFDLTNSLLAAKNQLDSGDWLGWLQNASNAAQHFDYDDDKMIEPTDGYVDARSLAQAIEVEFDGVGDVPARAQTAALTLADAVVWWATASGQYQNNPMYEWILDNSYGLSIFFPVFEDLWVGGGCPDLNPGERVPEPPPAGCYKLREYYTDGNFAFALAGQWDELVRELLSPDADRTLNKPRPGLLPGPEKPQ